MYEDKRYVLAVALFFAAAAQSVLAISLGHSNVRAPSHFEYNAGQYVADVVYRGRFTGHDAALFRDGSAALYPRSASADGSRKLGVRLRLLHASQPESVQADLPSDFRTHYLRDGDSGRNLTDVPHFGRIVFRNVYPGIDLAYHSSDGQLEYDFIVSPGAQPERISISIEGASKTEIDDAGDIVIWAGEHRLRQKRPVAFQLRNDKKIRVECAYRMDETGNVTLALGAYDKSRDLIIDPVVEYASYLGGTSIDQGKAVRLGPDGFIYVTGLTRSTKFPTLGAFDSTLGGNWDVFVSKVNPATGKLVYSTYLGGANEDEPTAIAIDSTGAAYVVGLAGDRFPTTSGAYQTGTGAAGFVAKISPTGSSLAYSTLVRGAIPTGVDIDVQGRAVVTGRAGSSFIPTSGALQTIYGGTTSAVDTTRDGDAFVLKLNASGTAPIFATFIGGPAGEESSGIAIDAAGRIAIGGYLPPNDIVGIQADGAAIAYAIQMPGGIVQSIAADTYGNIIVAGYAAQTLPMVNAVLTPAAVVNNSGSSFQKSFVAKFAMRPDPELVFSTFTGSRLSCCESSFGVAVDSVGDIFVLVAVDARYMDYVTHVRPFLPAAYVTQKNAGLNMDVLLAAGYAREGGRLLFQTVVAPCGGGCFDASIHARGVGQIVIGGTTVADWLPVAASNHQAAQAGTSDDAFAMSLNLESRPLELRVSSTAATAGEPLRLTASSYGAGASGEVTFWNGEIPLGTVALVEGIATHEVILSQGLGRLSATIGSFRSPLVLLPVQQPAGACP